MLNIFLFSPVWIIAEDSPVTIFLYTDDTFQSKRMFFGGIMYLTIIPHLPIIITCIRSEISVQVITQILSQFPKKKKKI